MLLIGSIKDIVEIKHCEYIFAKVEEDKR